MIVDVTKILWSRQNVFEAEIEIEVGTVYVELDARTANQFYRSDASIFSEAAKTQIATLRRMGIISERG